MTDQDQRARLSFLARAAQSYATSAPSTSAHLVTQYRAVAAEHSSGSPLTQPNNTCGACGSIMIPGRTCRTRLDDRSVTIEGATPRKKKRPNRSKSSPSGTEKTLTTECLLCWKSTKKSLQRRKSSKLTEIEGSNQVAGPSRTTTATPGDRPTPRISNNNLSRATPANASSKKRAKARKESRLGALLAKSKSSQAPSLGFGLDLMDMMKEV
ncbi:hypothetical protein MMC08_005903 [Hypocenomyce scalaris]|nr:hypothetical protein [Hypocenomyce scalaris]